LRHQSQARIINIVSFGGKVAVPHLLPYSASKFALAGLSQGLRVELARTGVKVTTVFPGLLRTGSAGNAFFKGQNRAEYAWFSLGASAPGLSLSADVAARCLLEASRRGDAEIVLGLVTKMATTSHALFPKTTTWVLGLANQLLPDPGGIGAKRALGRHSGSALSPSLLTLLGDRAARRNNEVSGTTRPERSAAA